MCTLCVRAQCVGGAARGCVWLCVGWGRVCCAAGSHPCRGESVRAERASDSRSYLQARARRARHRLLRLAGLPLATTLASVAESLAHLRERERERESLSLSWLLCVLCANVPTVSISPQLNSQSKQSILSSAIARLRQPAAGPLISPVKMNFRDGSSHLRMDGGNQ